MAGRRQSNPTPRRHAKAPAESRRVVSPMGHLLRRRQCIEPPPASRRRLPASLPPPEAHPLPEDPLVDLGTPLPRALGGPGPAPPEATDQPYGWTVASVGSGEACTTIGLTVFHVKHRTVMPAVSRREATGWLDPWVTGARSPNDPMCPHCGPTTRSGYLSPSRAYSPGPGVQPVVGPLSGLGDDPTRMPGDLTGPGPSWWSGLRGGCGVRRGQGARSRDRTHTGGRAHTWVPLTTSRRAWPQSVRCPRRPGTDHGPRAMDDRHDDPPLFASPSGQEHRASSSSFHVKHEVMSPRHGPLRLGSAGVGSGWRDDRPPPSCRRPRWGVSGWPHHRSTQVLTPRRGLVTWVLVPIRARSRGFHATSEAEEGYRAL